MAVHWWLGGRGQTVPVPADGCLMVADPDCDIRHEDGFRDGFPSRQVLVFPADAAMRRLLLQLSLIAPGEQRLYCVVTGPAGGRCWVGRGALDVINGLFTEFVELGGEDELPEPVAAALRPARDRTEPAS